MTAKTKTANGSTAEPPTAKVVDVFEAIVRDIRSGRVKADMALVQLAAVDAASICSAVTYRINMTPQTALAVAVLLTDDLVCDLKGRYSGEEIGEGS